MQVCEHRVPHMSVYITIGTIWLPKREQISNGQERLPIHHLTCTQGYLFAATSDVVGVAMFWATQINKKNVSCQQHEKEEDRGNQSTLTTN